MKVPFLRARTDRGSINSSTQSIIFSQEHLFFESPFHKVTLKGVY